MAWKCACGAQNELYTAICKECGDVMPQRERNKMYRQELMIQIKECMVLIRNSAVVKSIENLLHSAKKNITEILAGTKKEDLKFLIIPLVVFLFIIFNIIVQVAGTKIDINRAQREQRRIYCTERREAFNENVRYKIEYALEDSGLFGEKTPVGQQVAEHIEGKKEHLKEKLQITVDLVIKYVKRGYEKCRLYFE